MELSLAQIWENDNNYKINITEYINIFYGINKDWNGTLYKYREIFPGKNKSWNFYLEFKNENNEKIWYYNNIGDSEQYFNVYMLNISNYNKNKWMNLEQCKIK